MSRGAAQPLWLSQSPWHLVLSLKSSDYVMSFTQAVIHKFSVNAELKVEK